jgi:hypothetical protein
MSDEYKYKVTQRDVPNGRRATLDTGQEDASGCRGSAQTNITPLGPPFVKVSTDVVFKTLTELAMGDEQNDRLSGIDIETTLRVRPPPSAPIYLPRFSKVA